MSPLFGPKFRANWNKKEAKISIKVALGYLMLKGVVVEILGADHFLITIFELSGVDYPRKHMIRTKFAVFEKSKKYYSFLRAKDR